jgi:NMT1-like family
VAKLAGASWRDLLLIFLPIAVVMFGLVWAAVTIIRPAPPDTIRLISGPDGSSYRSNAEKYQKIIEGFGVKVEVLPSRGSLDNLQRLTEPASRVDVGFVQSGLAGDGDATGLVSLGTVFAQPLMVYHRLPQPLELLSQLKGKRLAVGPVGSGSRALALKLLEANDIAASPTVLVDLNGEEAARALAAGEIDAAFLMGDSATSQVMRSLRNAPGVDLMNFRQAGGYVRRFHFLSRLTLPEGSIDFAKNYPPRAYDLIGPTVELVARKDLHPALSDLLIRAARQVHGAPGLFRDAGEFPTAAAHDFPLSADAERYYKSGEQFLYRRMPFWLASLVDRTLVVIVPLLVVILPATRVAPALYRWRVRSRIYRWYGSLMAIERDIQPDTSPEQRQEIARRLDEIENALNEIKTPLAFADQLYLLRSHVAMVRQRLDAGPQGRASP